MTRNESNSMQIAIKTRMMSDIANLVVIVLGVVAAYFLTLQSLKLELAAKAENTVVETLDKKLAGFEVLLKEGVPSKEEFHQVTGQIEQRLSRIEFYLQEGEKRGKR